MTTSDLVLSGDLWVQRTASDWEVPHPSLEEVANAIEKLDQVHRSLVQLQLSGRKLVIGGGSGRYVVYCEDAPDEFIQLVTDAQSLGPKATVRIGGQEGDFAAECVVGKEQAIEAAKFFAEHDGSLAPSFSWKRA